MIDEGFQRWRTDPVPARARDEIMCQALESAALQAPRNPVRESFLEALLEQALVSAWELWATGGDARPRARIAVPGWDPQPGATDLVLSMLGDRQPTAIAELKVLDVEQTLWDLLKLLSILEDHSHFVRGYLVVATTPKRWRGAEVAALYATPDAACPDGIREWETRDLLSRWERSWKYLLEGGRARPRVVPGGVRTRFLGSHPVPSFPDYELRAIAVEPLTSEGRLRFGEAGWPTPLTGAKEQTFTLRDPLESHLAARQNRRAHPDLRAYHEARASAAGRAFGIDLERPPAHDSGLAGLLNSTLDRLASIGSPFDGHLEAPGIYSELYRLRGPAINDTNNILPTACSTWPSTSSQRSGERMPT